MNWEYFTANWRTTLGGLLAAVPPVITAAGFVLSPTKQHWLALCQGIGVLLLGLAAKDSNTHSNLEQVRESTIKDEIQKAENPPAK